MHVVRAALITAGFVALPSVGWAQTTTSTSAPTTSTTAASVTTTTTVTRIEDVVCWEPVNNIATCVDPEGRIVTRVDEPRQMTTTLPEGQQPLRVEPHGIAVAPDAGPTHLTVGRQLALTG